MKTKIHVAFVVLMLVCVPLVAAAQDAPAPGGAEGPGQIHLSPKQQECLQEIKNDPSFNAFIEEGARYAFHRDETSKATRNNEHVIMAYAAIWVLTVFFVVLVFLRQGKLKAELARLQADLARATKDA
jgi:CcmD family protein